MSQTRESDKTPPSEPCPPPEAWRQVWRRRLQVVHALVLLLLLTLFLAYVVETRLEPVYGWIRDTPVETFGRQLLPFLWQQRERLANTAEQTPLSSDERARLDAKLARMENIRPTHVVLWRDGRRLFGRMQPTPDRPEALALRYYRAGRFETIPIDPAETALRQALVMPTGELDLSDERFLLEHERLDAYFAAPYLFVTDADFNTIYDLYQILSQVSDEFRQTFSPVIEPVEGSHHLRVCFFLAYQDYLAEANKYGDPILINSAGFFSKTHDTLFLYDRTRHAGQAGPAPARLDRSHSIAQSVAAITRHEAAHQLAAALNVLPRYDRVSFWLQEGLAQYYETTPPGAPDPDKLALLRQARATSSLIPWTELLALDSAETLANSSTREQLAYAQAWLLCRHFLERERRPGFLRYLLARQQKPPPSDTHADSVDTLNQLHTTATQLEHELDRALSPAPAPAR